MKDMLYIGGLCLIIVVVGAALYFFEPDHGDARGEGSVRFTLLTEGQHAVAADREANYRITSREQLDTLWTQVYGSDRPNLPAIDFERYEVLAVFDGSHSTGGYDITVTEVVDAGLVRTVHILHTRPGNDCMLSTARSSPYELIVLPKMREGLRLAHTDQIERKACR